MIILSLFKLILVLVALIAAVLLVAGTPVGLVLLFVYIFDKKKRSTKLGKWILILLSGVPLLVLVFVAWALISLIATLFGVNTIGTPQDGLMMIK